MSPQQPPLSPYPPQSAVVRAQTFASRFLWTTIPVLTVGLLGWVPALHVARSRRTPKGWWWFVGLLAGAVGECVLVGTVPSTSHGNAETFSGTFCLGYIITATVYAWKGCGAPPRVPGSAGYATTMWMATTLDGTPYPPPYPVSFPVAPPVPPVPAPTAAAASTPVSAADMAAEVQADLRELRGFLGGGDAR
jgi:hypothetical protein